MAALTNVETTVLVFTAAWEDPYCDTPESVADLLPLARQQLGLKKSSDMINSIRLSLDDEAASTDSYYNRDKSTETIQRYQITKFPFIVRLVDNAVAVRKPLVMPPRTCENAEPTADVTVEFAKASACYDSFDISGAIKSFLNVLRIDPRHKSALFNLGSLFHVIECPSLAVGYVETLLTITSDDHTAHSFLWALTNHEHGREAGMLRFPILLLFAWGYFIVVYIL
jgi:hypothetical protein